MTKMIKMSLIAAVAVTSMTSVASAQPLEEAIKGVDVSGMLRYRYDDTNNDTATNKTSTQTNEYTMHLNVASKVNDMVTANVKVEALGVSDISSSDAHATTDATGDRDVTLSVTKANFAANLGVATVIAGKQSVPSPLVDNSVDDTARGTGAVALVPAGPVTIAAGYFNNFQRAESTLNTGENIVAAAVLGKVADVSFDAWMVDVDAIASAVSVGAKAAVAGVNVDARYSKVNPDANGAKDGGLTKLVASAKVGPATVVAGLAMTPKDNTGATLDGDADAQSDFKVWQASVGSLQDATAYLIGASMPVMANLTVGFNYVAADFTAPATSVDSYAASTFAFNPATGKIDETKGAKTTTTTQAKSADASELLLTATYAMSKNFSVHARMSWYDVDVAGTEVTDTTKGRLELKYSF